MSVLTAIDICGIQGFIFSSNRLKDIINNSKAIEWATSFNPKDTKDGLLSSLDLKESEVLMSGGGNVFLIFESIDRARDFAARYSRKIYDNFPFMKVAIVHRKFGENNQLNLAEAIDLIGKDLAIYKQRNILDRNLLGLGVTISCPNTGRPANYYDSDKKEVISKNNFKQLAKSKLSLEGCGLDEYTDKYVFTDELDKLGRTMHDTSYLGIVHIDGNSIGNKIKNWIKNKKRSNSSNDIINEYRQWSNRLSEIAKNSFKEVCKKLIEDKHIVYNDKENNYYLKGDIDNLNFRLLKDNQGKVIFPVRPIIIGGDDITFVCDGRIALSLAEVALKTFNTNIPELGKEKIGACAGVAFIKTHTPFIKGYELAESLCANSKETIKDTPEKCAIDWHIGNIKPFTKINEIRNKQYNESRLTLKPYILDFTDNPEKGSWQWLSKIVLGDSENGFRGNIWLQRKNKIKDLVSELKKDSDQFKLFVDSLKVVTPSIDFPIGIDDLGRTNGGSSIIDAIEILDIHQTFEKRGM